MTPAQRSPWLNRRIAVVVCLVFVCGALAGALAMRSGMQASRPAPQAAYYAIGDQKVALEQLVRELELNPAQAAQLETVLDDFVMYVQTLQTQMDEVRASGKARILNILDEKQRVKFEKMMTGLQARQR
jgi:hypothetical protein